MDDSFSVKLRKQTNDFEPFFEDFYFNRSEAGAQLEIIAYNTTKTDSTK